MRRALILLSVSFMSVLLTCSKSSQNPSWSEDKLDTAAAYAKDIGSAAVLVLYDGQVVFSFGDTTRKYMCHSIRKPFLGALYGIYVGKGIIDIDTTLEELNIDDIPPLLTPAEKQATIRDLLMSRSGVYHEATGISPCHLQAIPDDPEQIAAYSFSEFGNKACYATREGILDATIDVREKKNE